MTDEQRQNIADYLATIEEIMAVITASSQDVGANTIIAARTALEGNVIMTSAAFEIFLRDFKGFRDFLNTTYGILERRFHDTFGGEQSESETSQT